jgi:hypothetical protein
VSPQKHLEVVGAFQHPFRLLPLVGPLMRASNQLLEVELLLFYSNDILYRLVDPYNGFSPYMLFVLANSLI